MRQAPTSPVRASNMVFAREPTSKPGRIAATAAGAMIARGRPEGSGEGAEAMTYREGKEVFHDDTPNRDMTH